MTLVEALKKHTGCTHKLSRLNGPVLRHGNEYSRLPYAFAESQVFSDAAAGSVLFHDAARWLLSLPDHTRHPLHITDEDYTGFVNG